MQELMIIGNLTKEPETRTTQNGKTVCTFTVAVNRRNKVQGQPEADFFQVSAWGSLGENCQKYLGKGRKVCVVGQISAHGYTRQDGTAGASMDVFAEKVEFLTPRGSGNDAAGTDASGMTPVEPDDLPWGVS